MSTDAVGAPQMRPPEQRQNSVSHGEFRNLWLRWKIVFVNERRYDLVKLILPWLRDILRFPRSVSRRDPSGAELNSVKCTFSGRTNFTAMASAVAAPRQRLTMTSSTCLCAHMRLSSCQRVIEEAIADVAIAG